jgi:hypothetical protein
MNVTIGDLQIGTPAVFSISHPLPCQMIPGASANWEEYLLSWPDIKKKPRPAAHPGAYRYLSYLPKEIPNLITFGAAEYMEGALTVST